MFLIELALVLGAAKLAGDLAMRCGMPAVFGQLAIGFALSLLAALSGQPAALSDATASLKQTAGLGALMLMFLAGMQSDWDQMRQIGRPAFGSALAGVLTSVAAGFAAGRAFGLPLVESLFVGIIITATSAGITAQALMEIGRLQTTEGATILGAAVMDDVIGLVVFSLATAATGSGTENLGLLVVLLALFFLGCFAIGGRFIPWVVERSGSLLPAEAQLTIALSIGLVLAFTAERVGIAGITGAYLAGLLMNRGNAFSQLTDKLTVLAYGLFVPVFLVVTGMEARVQDVSTSVAFILVLSATAVGSKVFGCALGARLTGLSMGQSFVIGAGMVARGEVTVIVASLALSGSLINQSVFSAAVVVVLVTTLASPLLLRLALRGLPGVEANGSLPQAT